MWWMQNLPRSRTVGPVGRFCMTTGPMPSDLRRIVPHRPPGIGCRRNAVAAAARSASVPRPMRRPRHHPEDVERSESPEKPTPRAREPPGSRSTPRAARPAPGRWRSRSRSGPGRSSSRGRWAPRGASRPRAGRGCALSRVSLPPRCRRGPGRSRSWPRRRGSRSRRSAGTAGPDVVGRRDRHRGRAALEQAVRGVLRRDVPGRGAVVGAEHDDVGACCSASHAQAVAGRWR